MKFNKVSLAIIIASGVLMGCEISNDVEAPVTMPNGNVIGSVDNEPDFVENIPDIYEGASEIGASGVSSELRNAISNDVVEQYDYYGEGGRYESRFKFDGNYTSTKVEQLENGNVRVLFKKDGDSSEAYNALFGVDVKDSALSDNYSTYGIWQAGTIDDSGDFVSNGTPFVVDYAYNDAYSPEGSAVFTGDTMAIKTENGEEKVMTGDATLNVDLDKNHSDLTLDFTGWKTLYLDQSGNIKVNDKDVEGRGNFDYSLIVTGYDTQYPDRYEDGEVVGYDEVETGSLDSAVGTYSADFKDGKDNHDVSVIGGFTSDRDSGSGITMEMSRYSY